MPSDGIDSLPHDEILSYEEIVRIAALALELGIRKIRLTGGEPLVRKDLPFLIRELAQLPGLQDLSMTTNGVKLAECAGSLKKAGLHRVNVSMDSLTPERFKALTRGGELDSVWQGLLTALEEGMHPVKINVVVIEGLNADEIIPFAQLTLDWPFEIRFIEWMPIGKDSAWQPSEFISSDQILASIQNEFDVIPSATSKGNGPAQIFQIAGGRGSFGIISPITHHFCNRCNRLRLTADGKVRTCLFSDEEIDLKAIIRAGASDDQLRSHLLAAIKNKPKGHHLDSPASLIKKCIRSMNRIGG
jgi:cyclic pyranopterin phosphate synthase